MSTGFSVPMRVLIHKRDRLKCVICGKPSEQIHHRRPRGMGGTARKTTNLPANGLTLCGSGTQGCHHTVESRRDLALENGWIVRQHQDPAEVPVLIHGDWWLLDNEGGRRPCP